MASAILPVAPAQGRWRVTVRAAHHSTPNCTKGCAPKIAHSGPTMTAKLWNVKVRFPVLSQQP